ncbi:choice-of-anchor L domain-containing protein [Rhodobacteraceae bacterium F11138]|nr:choice-of-anchor L domain-containing protein [Rhodobacteraceae bacterium F11138]
MPTASELPIDTSATANQMAEAMFGDSIQILTAEYTGADSASGIYSDGDAVAGMLTPSDTGVILSTGNARDITNSSGDANRISSTSTSHGRAGDEDLEEIAGSTTYDAAVFESTFIPDGSVLTMQVTFSSEEYLEYVNSGFNDAVGVWVNGEKAELRVGDGDITINNINDETNSNLYVDNPANADIANTEMDGFTATLTLKAPVQPGVPNSIKIAIADGGDSAYDSNLLIAGESVQTALVAGDDAITVHGTAPEEIDVRDNDTTTAGGSLTITHINGQPVSAGDTVTLPTGESITLAADGTFQIVSDGEAGLNTFSYSVEDADGNTDIGFVKLTTVPCFVAGTLIDTTQGPVPVETLVPGALIRTRDRGYQPLRWIGHSHRTARGKDAPVVFAKDSLGNHDRIAVSPCHRVLLTSWRAELLFGCSEVLVMAKSLIDDCRIRSRADGGAVHYVHLLFDRHEIIRGNGLDSESYHPGAQTLDAFDAQTRAELFDLMPELAQGAPQTYGPTARPALKPHEARLLLQS